MADIIPEIVARRARRGLSYRPVAEESLERCIKAATLAPSCMNNQPWRFVVVTAPDRLEPLREALSAGNAWARRAPCIVAAVTEAEGDCRLTDRREYALFDLGLAVANLILQATREALIAHPIAGFRPEVVKEVLGIPSRCVVASLVIVGHPGDEAALSDKQRADERAERARKPLEQVRMRNRWEGEP